MRPLETVLVIAVSAAPLALTAKHKAATRTRPGPKGKAAFYSKTLEGHKTACGRTYEPTAMTTAHKTLRCGTKVRISNLKNSKSAEAVVTDRLSSPKRTVDFSRAVAEQLDCLKKGTTPVQVEVLP